MKIAFLIPLLASMAATATWAQDRIYRCGNEYTNTVSVAEAKNCKLISGGNVTVVQAHKPAPRPAASGPSGGPRVDSADQRSKDSDSRLILESELKKAEARKLDLQKEYNNGEPERTGPEVRNQQKYLERVAELKAAIARNESDIDGIRRELSRVNAATVAGSSANTAK